MTTFTYRRNVHERKINQYYYYYYYYYYRVTLSRYHQSATFVSSECAINHMSLALKQHNAPFIIFFRWYKCFKAAVKLLFVKWLSVICTSLISNLIPGPTLSLTTTFLMVILLCQQPINGYSSWRLLFDVNSDDVVLSVLESPWKVQLRITVHSDNQVKIIGEDQMKQFSMQMEKLFLENPPNFRVVLSIVVFVIVMFITW